MNCKLQRVKESDDIEGQYIKILEEIEVVYKLTKGENKC